MGIGMSLYASVSNERGHYRGEIFHEMEKEMEMEMMSLGSWFFILSPFLPSFLPFLNIIIQPKHD